VELDKTFERRDIVTPKWLQRSINRAQLGRQVLRYEIKDLRTQRNPARQPPVANHGRAREEQALIAASEGRRQNRSTSPPAANLHRARSRGAKLAAINNAQGGLQPSWR
jgi:hypothetical protein